MLDMYTAVLNIKEHLVNVTACSDLLRQRSVCQACNMQPLYQAPVDMFIRYSTCTAASPNHVHYSSFLFNTWSISPMGGAPYPLWGVHHIPYGGCAIPPMGGAPCILVVVGCWNAINSVVYPCLGSLHHTLQFAFHTGYKCAIHCVDTVSYTLLYPALLGWCWHQHFKDLKCRCLAYT